MKYIFFFIFVILNLVLLLKMPSGDARSNYLKIFGFGIPLTFVLAAVVLLLVKFSGNTPSGQFKNVFFAVVVSILSVMLVNFMCLVGDYFLERMINFHNVNNASNADSFPVSFVVKNLRLVRIGMRMVFLLASTVGLYGIWLSKINE
ncbi:MAG: hypothetical protein EOO90_17775 [Pedobacter sp.]|nr:MAG: hypothetical protein EOO90_17775 [Pedobacter sp.]